MGQAAPVRTVEGAPLLISLGLCLLISAVDWALPAGVLVGMLLCVPILMASGSSRPADVWIVLACAVGLFVSGEIFGPGPQGAVTVWLPNRVIVLVSFPATALLSRALQDQRLEAVRTRDDAVFAGDLNRLLFALLAHDLRSPLQLSRQMFDYLQATLESGAAPDPELLRDVRARIDRNLRSIDGVLAAARTDLAAPTEREAGNHQARASIADEITQEVLSFQHEAQLRQKRVLTDLTNVEGSVHATDALVLRQVLAIAIDNAIRYGNKGDITVLARTASDVLLLRIEDPGPGIQANLRKDPARAPRGGAGLGLQLCELLLNRSGGGMRLEDRDGKGCVEAWLPLHAGEPSPVAASTAAPASPQR